MPHQSAEERLDEPLEVSTQIKDTGTWARSVAISVSSEEVNKEFDAVAKDIAGMVNLPGFRPGKVPRNVIEKRFGGDIGKQVTQNLLQRGLRSALNKENLDVVGEPRIDPEKYKASRGEAFNFDVEVEVKPTFELGNYKGLVVEQEEVELLPDEIDQAIDRLRDRFAETIDAAPDHAVENKDAVHGILRVLVDGVEVYKEEDAQLLVMDGHVLGAHAHLGSQYLEGSKIGEKRTVEESLSGAFPVEAQRGKKGTIEVEIKKIQSRKLPDLNDELAAKLNFKTVDELKTKVRSTLLDRLRDEVEEHTQSTLMDKIIEATPFDLPARLHEAMASSATQNRLRYFERMGMTPEMFASQMDGFLEESRKEAEREIRRYLIVDAIAVKENLSTDEDEIDAEILKLARQHDTRASDLYDKMVEDGELRELENQVKTRKVMDYLAEQADIKIVPRKAPEKHEHSEHAHEHGHEHGEEHGAEHGDGHDHGHEHGAEHGHEHGHEHGKS